MLTDYLIIGSGIAGLSFALKVSEHLPDATITIITKSSANEGSTRYAQGGIAVVLDSINDSFDKHINDTLLAGDGLCNPEIVEMVVKKAPERLEELIRYGVNFNKNNSKEYDLGKEGGHSANRILHHYDSTGNELENVLLRNIENRSNIFTYPYLFVLDLIIKNNICVGVYTHDVNTGFVDKIVSKVTLLATGGIGQVFKFTTNPMVSTGDGIAMAFRAKAKVSEMEFVQFHPTAFYEPCRRPLFLISEAIRGNSAVLKTINGKEFMLDYNKDKDLATRDIVSRAIDIEIKKTDVDYLFLDCSSISPKKFKTDFPSINKECRKLGLNIPKEQIPVIPAAHFICGGVKTDKYGKTSIQNLYACGECANTGLHGANRLASNSLLESLVFSNECAIDSISLIHNIEFSKDIQEYNNQNNKQYSFNHIKDNLNEINSVMSKNIGVFTDNKMLCNAMSFIKEKHKEIEEICITHSPSSELYELRNITQVALLIVQQSIERNENRGVFFNKDIINY